MAQKNTKIFYTKLNTWKNFKYKISRRKSKKWNKVVRKLTFIFLVIKIYLAYKFNRIASNKGQRRMITIEELFSSAINLKVTDERRVKENQIVIFCALKFKRTKFFLLKFCLPNEIHVHIYLNCYYP